MNTVDTNESIDLENATEVLADCLMRSHSAYLELLMAGQDSDAYKELGLTVRSLANSLAETNLTYGEEELDDDD